MYAPANTERRCKPMALIKVKELREAIQLIKTVLEKLDVIYHVLKEKE